MIKLINFKLKRIFFSMNPQKFKTNFYGNMYFLFIKGLFFINIFKLKFYNFGKLFFFKQSFFSFFFNLLKKKYNNKGFYIQLQLLGYGYRWWFDKKNNQVRFLLGYSHSIIYNLPKKFKIICKKGCILLFNYNNVKLGHIIEKFKYLRPVNLYKGTGIKKINENIKLKKKDTKLI